MILEFFFNQLIADVHWTSSKIEFKSFYFFEQSKNTISDGRWRCKRTRAKHTHAHTQYTNESMTEMNWKIRRFDFCNGRTPHCTLWFQCVTIPLSHNAEYEMDTSKRERPKPIEIEFHIRINLHFDWHRTVHKRIQKLLNAIIDACVWMKPTH